MGKIVNKENTVEVEITLAELNAIMCPPGQIVVGPVGALVAQAVAAFVREKSAALKDADFDVYRLTERGVVLHKKGRPGLPGHVRSIVEKLEN
jgi:hypothetical protein